MGIFLAILLTILVLEVIFRIVYEIYYGRTYYVAKKIPWDKMYVVPHPNLSFAYKPNSLIDTNSLLSYTLHFRKFLSFKKALKINNMGHFGNDFSFSKPDNVIRVACLGASTTANNIATVDMDYSYPEILEKKMRDRMSPSIIPEVYNCGIGGWVSIDILVDFLLNIIRTHPDYVILYYGYNDLHLYLSENFRPDYSHNRLNFGEKIGWVRWVHMLPKISYWQSYEYLKTRFLGTGDTRSDVVKLISPNKINLDANFGNLVVERDIIKHLLVICRHYGIKVILSSFVYYNYDKVKASNKYQEGVEKENIMMKELSQEFGLKFVDQDANIPQNDKYLLDHVHLTPEGMDLLAENFAQAIIEIEREKNENAH